jgi:hypothetical protein
VDRGGPEKSTTAFIGGDKAVIGFTGESHEFLPLLQYVMQPQWDFKRHQAERPFSATENSHIRILLG